MEKFEYYDLLLEMHQFYFGAFIIQLILTMLFVGYTLDRLRQIKPNKKKVKSKHLYCYDCEIEMPVIKSKGNFYCSNCKLIHTNEFKD